VNRWALHSVTGVVLVALVLPACKGGGGSSSRRRAQARAAAMAAAPAPTAASASGVVSIPPATAVDGDVNDPEAALAPNDALATAQLLPNPVMLGGYANQPGAGPAGRSQAGGDVRDYYRASLEAGDEVKLFVEADPAVNDLDLALLAPDGTPLAMAAEAGASESLTAPADGEYLIEVSAFAGAAPYVLTLAPGVGVAQAPPEFVPGELIVRFGAEPAGAPDAAGAAEVDGLADADMAERVAALGLEWAAGAPEGEMLLHCGGAQQRDAAFQALGIGHLLDPDPEVAGLPMAQQLLRDTPRLAKALRRRADVESADLNYVRRPSAVPQDQYYPLQWHYPQIRLAQAWDAVAPNSGVVVAVLDTGVALAHPELEGQLVDGYDFIASPASAGDGNGCDPDPDDPGDGLEPGTSSYHGTHVTGTLVARTSLQPAGGTAGVAGVAWNAKVMPLRVIGRAGGTDFDLMQALRYAAGMPNDCNALPQAPADVINMSLGGPGRSDAFAALLGQVRQAGLVVVAAAGNSANDQPIYPAAYPGVVSVSAVDIQKKRARYSSYGPTIDVAAPGGDTTTDLNADGYADGVLSLFVDDTGAQDQYVYLFSAGTSMAAPHVAGVIALMLGVHPQLTPDDLDALLAAGQLTEDLGNPAFYGAGLIDAQKALQAAAVARDAGVAVTEARLAVEPVNLRFGPLQREWIATASNAGAADQPLTVAAVRTTTDDGAPWLSAALLDAAPTGLGRYRIAVNRAGLGAGVYTGRVVFDSDRNDVEVPVVLEVAAPSGVAANAGRHRVLLLDAATGQTRHVLALEASGGAYSFRFDEVPPGEYLLMAGSDLDGDGRICEPGEACGAWPNLAQRQALRLDLGTRAGLDFETAFRIAAELTAIGAQPQPIAVGAAP
jgi:serine protease